MKRARLFLILVPIAILALLVTGFCFRDFRYLGDREMIEIAVRENLRRHAPGTERSKAYASLAEFFGQNPNCCQVYRGVNDRAGIPMALAALFGLHASTVMVNYRMVDEAKEPFYESHVVMDCCGRVLATYGMPHG